MFTFFSPSYPLIRPPSHTFSCFSFLPQVFRVESWGTMLFALKEPSKLAMVLQQQQLPRQQQQHLEVIPVFNPQFYYKLHFLFGDACRCISMYH